MFKKSSISFFRLHPYRVALESDTTETYNILTTNSPLIIYSRLPTTKHNIPRYCSFYCIFKIKNKLEYKHPVIMSTKRNSMSHSKK
jgi:hypothetical protein